MVRPGFVHAVANGVVLDERDGAFVQAAVRAVAVLEQLALAVGKLAEDGAFVSEYDQLADAIGHQLVAGGRVAAPQDSFHALERRDRRGDGVRVLRPLVVIEMGQISR